MKYHYVCTNCELTFEIEQNINKELFYRCPSCMSDDICKTTIDDVSIKTIVVDVDGVIASKSHGGDYPMAEPLTYGISQVNKLFDLGYHIILYTARYGDREKQCIHRQYSRGHGELTEWLKKYNVKYHELWCGKPAAVMYIDDKAVRVSGDNAHGWLAVNEEINKLAGKDKYGNIISRG